MSEFTYPGSQRGSQVLWFWSGWGLAAVARELSSEGAAGQGWKNRVTGQLESSRIWIYRVCKGWGSPPEHKCGLSNLKARRHGITKVVLFLCIEHSVCYYTYIPLLLLVFTFCPFSVHIQCPKQVIISKICKCSSWPYEKLQNCNVRVWNHTQNGNIWEVLLLLFPSIKKEIKRQKKSKIPRTNSTA